MPVILEPENYELWLDPGLKDLDTLTATLKPFDPALMKCYFVGTLMNSPAHDTAECAAEAEALLHASEPVLRKARLILLTRGKVTINAPLRVRDE